MCAVAAASRLIRVGGWAVGTRSAVHNPSPHPELSFCRFSLRLFILYVFPRIRIRFFPFSPAITTIITVLIIFFVFDRYATGLPLYIYLRLLY
jgi:hypothetical protein